MGAGQMLQPLSLPPMGSGRGSSLLPSVQLIEATAKRPRVLDGSDIRVVVVAVDASADDVTTHIVVVVNVPVVIIIVIVGRQQGGPAGRVDGGRLMRVDAGGGAGPIVCHLEGDLHVVAATGAARPQVEVRRRGGGDEEVVLARMELQATWGRTEGSEQK